MVPKLRSGDSKAVSSGIKVVQKGRRTIKTRCLLRLCLVCVSAQPLLQRQKLVGVGIDSGLGCLADDTVMLAHRAGMDDKWAVVVD